MITAEFCVQIQGLVLGAERSCEISQAARDDLEDVMCALFVTKSNMLENIVIVNYGTGHIARQ